MRIVTTANFRIAQQRPSSFHNGYNPKSLGRLTLCGSLCRRRPCVTATRRLATCTSPVRRKTSGVTSAPTGCRCSASPGTTSQRTTPWRVPCPGPGEEGTTFQNNNTLLCHGVTFFPFVDRGLVPRDWEVVPKNADPEGTLAVSHPPTSQTIPPQPRDLRTTSVPSPTSNVKTCDIVNRVTGCALPAEGDVRKDMQN